MRISDWSSDVCSSDLGRTGPSARSLLPFGPPSNRTGRQGMSKARNLSVDGDRLWASLMDMARIGATEKGGSRRLALTDLDREGRDLFAGWCRDAGCTVTVDAMGNIFARRPGRDDALAPVVTGSHQSGRAHG